MKAPKPLAIHWWQRGVLDGKTCARKRRARYFELYKMLAIEALSPGELLGPCECVYRVAFRAGYDAEKEARERRNSYSPRPRKRGNLSHS